jgi:hypothetical protein
VPASLGARAPWALAALQAAVTLSWQAYAYFQPRLLAHFGFVALAGALGWYLALAGSTLGPLAGDASDRLVRSGGDRFPVVRAGVALAAASFLAVALTAGADGASPVRWTVPFFVAVWIAGMTVFQAPALALLRDVRGPQTMITHAVVATVVPAALWPWLVPFLAWAGGSLSFLAGGIAVVSAAVALGRSVIVPPPEATDGAPAGPVRPFVPFAWGLASAVAVLTATSLVPEALPVRAQVSAGSVAVAGALAAIAVRRSRWASGRMVPIAGVALTVLCRLVAPWSAGGVAVAVALAAGVGLGLHLATALPFTLSARPAGRAGLVSGLYVAGAAAGSAMVRSWLGQ